MAREVGKPKILLVSCCRNTEGENLVERLTNSSHEELSRNCSSDNSTLSEHDWSIENKYYTAELRLVLAKDSKPTSTQVFDVAKAVEAVIIAFEGSDETSFLSATEWGKLFKERDEVEIKILLAEESAQERQELNLTRDKVTDWCLKNSFEFVESAPTETGSEEDAFAEKYGIERVREALDAHMWPNMKRNLNDSKTKEGAHSKTENLSAKESEYQKDDVGENADEDVSAVNGNEAGLESFEELFGRMQDMKVHAQSLPDEERKKYAEKVTLEFWRAMGLDEDEISGL